MSHQTLWMYPAIFYHGKHPLDPHSAAFCQLRMDGFASHAAATGEFWKWQIAGSTEIIDIGNCTNTVTHHIDGLGKGLVITAADDHAVRSKSVCPLHHLLHQISIFIT